MSRNIYNNSQQPIQTERILSALSYLTYGLIGIIWLIIAYIRKIQLRQFLNFNIVQSIIISLLISAIYLILNFIESFLSLLNYIPYVGTFINSIFQFFIFYIAGFAIIRIGIFSFSLLSLFFLILIMYTGIWPFLGKTPEIPYITNNIRRLL